MHTEAVLLIIIKRYKRVSLLSVDLNIYFN